MTTVTITLTLHGPYRVATGSASRGLDAVVDRERIPATSLKGVMRNAAVEVLGLDEATVERIFGGAGAASPWAWSDVELPQDDRAVVRSRVRIPIDRETGVAADGALFHAEEMWVGTPLTFTVELFGAASDPRGDAAILAAAALAVKGLGASRRRGLGWVTLAPALDGQPVTPAAATRAVMAARGATT